MSRRTFWSSIALFCLSSQLALAQTPQVGQKAPPFALATPEGKVAALDELTKKGPAVLVILRGYPGYQCPYCTKQVHDFVEHASAFAASGTQVLLVYPGPTADLNQRAKEFLAKQNTLPENIHLVVDLDYRVTRLYGLRWDAPHETAYPSTFVLDRHDMVLFEKVSRGHGDRMSAADTLAELTRSPPKQ